VDRTIWGTSARRDGRLRRPAGPDAIQEREDRQEPSPLRFSSGRPASRSQRLEDLWARRIEPGETNDLTVSGLVLSCGRESGALGGFGQSYGVPHGDAFGVLEVLPPHQPAPTDLEDHDGWVIVVVASVGAGGVVVDA
jgi:hypothetical protein